MSSTSASAGTSTSGPDTGTTLDTTREDSSSSGGSLTTVTASSTATTTGETDTESTTTIEPTSTTFEVTSSSSSSSSTTMVDLQPCPYGELDVPDTLLTTTYLQNDEWSNSCGGEGNPDISYTLTAPVDGLYVIDTVGSAIDTILAVYDGECAGDEIACNDDDPIDGPQSRVSLDLTAGQTVTVVVDSSNETGGQTRINVASYGGVCPNGDLGNTVPASTSGTTVGGDNTLFASCGGELANDDAFTFTAPEAGVYTFHTLGSDFDTVLYVYDDCGGMELACNDDGVVDQTSFLSLPMAQDEQVVVSVDGADVEEGNYELYVDLDQCPDFDLGNAFPHTVMGSTAGLPDANNGGCGADGGAPDVAYTWTAPATDFFFFDTVGSNFDTRVYVYDGSTCVGMELGCDDDSGGFDGPSILGLDLVQDQTVTIVVDGAGGDFGNFVLHIRDTCGDGVINGDESCEGYQIDTTTCEDLGYVGGSLDCAADCSFDVSECSDTVVAVCSQPGAAISEALAAAEDTISVADMGTIADVDVFVDITHTYVSDFDITLSADDLGLSNTLHNSQCNGNDDVWAFYNDEGNGPPDCLVPYAVEGNVTPSTDLDVYDGGEASGSWTITVADTVGGDQGTLNEWCLYLTLE